MLSTLDIVDKVYSVLHTAGMTDVFKDSKPVDIAKSEYIVVNSLAVNADELQECPVNINIHMADVDVSRRIPNRASLNTLALEIIEELDDYQDGEIDIALVFQSPLIQEENIPEHFINLRFVVRHIKNT